MVGGGLDDADGVVEFRATWVSRDDGPVRRGELHERSRFAVAIAGEFRPGIKLEDITGPRRHTLRGLLTFKFAEDGGIPLEYVEPAS